MPLEAGQKLFHDEFAREMAITDLDGLRRSNEELESMIRRLGEEPLAREEAFRAAVAFEDDQNEHMIFDILEIEASEPARGVMDSLEQDNLVHAQKIRDYAADQGISIAPE